MHSSLWKQSAVTFGVPGWLGARLHCHRASGHADGLTVYVPHMLLCGWAAGKHCWPHLGWPHAGEAAWDSPGFQTRLHHTELCLHCWPGHSHPHLVEQREIATRSEHEIMWSVALCLNTFTMLYECVQSFHIAVFSSDPQRSHPMSIPGSYFGSVSKQQH